MAAEEEVRNLRQTLLLILQAQNGGETALRSDGGRVAGERRRPPETPTTEVNDLDDLTTERFDTPKPLILAC